MKIIFIFLFFVFQWNTVAFAENSQNLKLGVLSYRPKEITMAQWQPLAKELERALPKHTIELVVMTYDELDKAAHDKTLDFVFTNPEHYIVLKNKLAMNAVATMISLESGHPLTHFAGVIFTRADRTDIQSISDLNNTTIASPAKHSLGGYLMQRWELEKNNVYAKSYSFTGMPHDKTVEEVLSGKVDAGFVRTGVLESLARTGKINLNEVHVLNSLSVDFKMPVLHSTENYPEWAFCVAAHINPEITRKVSLALLSIKSDSNIAKTAGIAGFNPPADYTPVEILMLRLKDHPNELKYFNVRDVIWRYREFVSILLVISALILILVGFLIIWNRRLKKLSAQNEKLLLAIEHSPNAIFITDLNANIEYVNYAFVKMTGYLSSEVIGKNPRLLKSGKTTSITYREVWRTLLSGHRWRGELVNRRKDCSEYTVSASITPVKTSNGSINHYVAIEEDITERKHSEELIKKLAFSDSLTNLPNRRKLLDRLHHTIALSQRENKSFAVFLMDLDKFKAVNDTLGHSAGDDLLKQVAKRITHRLRSSDMVARLGGDEFVVVLENCQKLEYAANVALDVIAKLTEPFELSDEKIVNIGASIGISIFPLDGNTPEKLMDNADIALYQAKENGRGCFAYYNKNS